MRVLVVEDDRSVRETLGIVLETYGYAPELVESGEQALERLRAHWPAVMLLDLTLIGMSGEELYAEIRRRFDQVPPTIVLSAAQHGEGRCKGMEGVRFLAKPYTLEQLIDVIREVAGQKRESAA